MKTGSQGDGSVQRVFNWNSISSVFSSSGKYRFISRTEKGMETISSFHPFIFSVSIASHAVTQTGLYGFAFKRTSSIIFLSSVLGMAP